MPWLRGRCISRCLILLEQKDFTITFECDTLYCFRTFSNYQSNHFIWNFKFEQSFLIWLSNERINITYCKLNSWVTCLLLNSYYIINHFFSFPVFIIWTFNKHISTICGCNFFLGYLYLGTTFLLQLTYSFSTLSYYQTNAIIGYRYYISLRWWRTIWSHHCIIYFMVIHANPLINIINSLSMLFGLLLLLSFLILKLSCYWKLFFSYLISGFLIRT